MLYRIQNAETGLTFETVTAPNQADALRQWKDGGERVVQFAGGSRPYVTGDHGACYIAVRVPESETMREP